MRITRFPFALAALALCAAPALAQFSAEAEVRTGCTRPAPFKSLRTAATSPLTFLPDAGDEVVIECESVGPIGSWAEEDDLAGFGGRSYLRWNGNNLFSQPGVDTLAFRFRVDTPGRYLIRIHSRHDFPDSSEENDCWARLDGGTWEKYFENTGSGGVGKWTWNGIYESTHAFPEYQLSAGIHTFEISGRSRNFKIDRVHVLPYATWFAQVTDPESEPLRTRPLLGQSLTFEIDDPSAEAGLVPGATATYLVGGLTPTSACGFTRPFGEVLLSASGPLVQAGAPVLWQGPGSPARHVGQVPPDASFLGASFTVQGLFVDSTGGMLLTDAVDLVVGNQ